MVLGLGVQESEVLKVYVPNYFQTYACGIPISSPSRLSSWPGVVGVEFTWLNCTYLYK